MKLRHRLLLALIAVGLIVSLASSALLVSLVRDVVRTAYLDDLRSRCRRVVEQVERDAPGEEQLGHLAEQLAAALDARVFLLDREARVVADSTTIGRPLAAPPRSAAEKPDVREARSAGWGSSRGPCERGDEACYRLTGRVDTPGTIGFVRVSVPVARVESVSGGQLARAAGVSLAALLVLGGMAYLGFRLLSKPVERITGCAERLGSGDLDCVIPDDGDDELARLRRALMQVRAFMIDRIDDLESSRALLDSVIASMQEGVLVVDGSRRMRLANDAFRRIFGLGAQSVENRAVTDIVRHPDLLGMIDDGLSSGTERHGRIEDLDRRGRTFEIEVAPLTGGRHQPTEGVVITLFDVTRIDRLEKTRRDFVANVSHELRTPLTSVKAAAATLLGSDLDDPVMTRRFLETINRHSERMAELVSDLADLSLIETGGLKLAPEPIDVAALVRDAMRQLEPKYAALELSCEIALPQPFTITVDRRRFEQVLVNLLDNGMKFNSPGGTIRVSGQFGDGQTGLGGPIVVVEDSGRGIPQHSLEKVFQRFYRVEPGAAQERGTGLGLAIVRHLVNLHGGRIYIESELGQGSRFVIELPDTSD
jgi:two-component system phosphate regulon sensor histidine kinase PhoR